MYSDFKKKYLLEYLSELEPKHIDVLICIIAGIDIQRLMILDEEFDSKVQWLSSVVASGLTHSQVFDMLRCLSPDEKKIAKPKNKFLPNEYELD